MKLGQIGWGCDGGGGDIMMVMIVMMMMGPLENAEVAYC